MKPIIDISYWQNPRNINYDKLAAAISGVIIRATYGSRKDSYFEQHYSEFKQRGVPVGVYSFITEYMPVDAQVATFASMCAGKTFELGYWGDVEAESGAELLTLPTIRDWLTLADTKVNQRVGIYTSWWMWQLCTQNATGFGNRPLWVAHYGVTNPKLPVGWTDYVLHQYTSSYFAAGYGYRLDANRFNGDEAKFQAFIASEKKPLPQEPPKPLFDAVVKSTATPYLNVRAASNASSTIVGRLYPGEKVQIFDTTDSIKPWYRIDVGKWAAGWYLERIEEEPVMPQPASQPLWQRDPRWSNVKLGFSDTTIGRYGCLLTCATMLVNEYLKTSYTPPQMNEIIKKANGFVSGNLFRFASLWEAFPSRIGPDKIIRTPSTPAPVEVIDALLIQGKPVIVETRLEKRYQHWVLIMGKEGGKYVMHDPWTGKRAYFQDVYGDAPRWIYSIVSYRHLGG